MSFRVTPTKRHRSSELLPLSLGTIRCPCSRVEGNALSLHSKALDGTGNIYVADGANHRVLKLGVGSSAQEVLPFTGLDRPSYVALDNNGSVFVTDDTNNQVLKLPVR
jgi:DNA-binding beta-propeller fold protein YncE